MTIDEINATPMDQLRFRDFLRLKAGRDTFSRLKLDALREMVSIIAVREAESAFDDPKQQSVCLRWVLRGLDADKAVRKVKTDLEVGENARARYYA
ncbi:MAG TPA: hypothetical protein VMV10_32940 [Pirellulales bacterium]|nr:hypothetical protein [Pirellulales bacterium]